MATTSSLFYLESSPIPTNQTPSSALVEGWDTTLNLNQSLSSMDVDVYTQHLSNQMAITLLPAILIIGINMVVATIGNIMVFYIYLTKFNTSSTRTAVLALASFDLATSCFSMPGEIVDLRYSYNFQSDVLCKAFRLGTTVVLVASGLTLLMVAVDRYRRICNPMKNHFTAKQIKKGALLCLFVGFICSIPSAVVYGLSKVPTAIEGVYGTECSIDQRYHNHILPLINNILQALIFISVFTAIIVLYSLLGRVVLKQNKFRRSVRKRSSQHEENRDNSVTEGSMTYHQADGSVSPTPDSIPEQSFPPPNIKDQDNAAEPTKSVPSKIRRRSVFRVNRRTSRDDAKTRKTTLMLFIITIVFVISFLPYLILKALQAVKKDFPTNSPTSDIILYNVFVRSYFFNSVANCFIYGFCSTPFRKESKRVILKLLFCCSQNNLRQLNI